MKKKIAVLPGDGIGREIASGAVSALQAVGTRFGHEFEMEYADIGGAAIDSHGTPLPESTLALAKSSDAILLGAVGGPKWDNLPSAQRPERGLLAIRKELGLFANLRPIPSFQTLVQSSPLKPEIAANVNMLIVRELTGGLYFGKPSERRGENNDEVVDTLQYTRAEIERIVVKAFEFAKARSGRLTSVDKANVLESSRMWREIVNEKAADYPEVTVDHMYVDAAAMKLISSPGQFDVMVTENLFGDILSDEASMITGSLGMLPSASLSASGLGLYEPVHGSAPDIAGENKANPLAMILSAALLLKYSLGMREEGEAIERAVQSVLNDGYGTPDLQVESSKLLGTAEMIELVTARIKDGQLSGSEENFVYM